MTHRQTRRAFTLVQLVIAVVAMAVVLRVVLEFGGTPAQTPEQRTAAALFDKSGVPLLHKGEFHTRDRADQRHVIELVPQSNSSGTFSAMLSLLRKHRPAITDENINELVDSLPPGPTNDDGQVIVILPTSHEPDHHEEYEPKCRYRD